MKIGPGTPASVIQISDAELKLEWRFTSKDRVIEEVRTYVARWQFTSITKTASIARRAISQAITQAAAFLVPHFTTAQKANPVTTSFNEAN